MSLKKSSNIKLKLKLFIKKQISDWITKLIWIEIFFDFSRSRLIDCMIDDSMFETFDNSIISKLFWSIKMNKIWLIEIFWFFFSSIENELCSIFFASFDRWYDLMMIILNCVDFWKKFMMIISFFKSKNLYDFFYAFVWFLMFSRKIKIFKFNEKFRTEIVDDLFWILKTFLIWRDAMCFLISFIVFFHNHDTLNNDKKWYIHFDHAQINIEHEQRENQFVEIDQIINDFENYL